MDTPAFCPFLVCASCVFKSSTLVFSCALRRCLRIEWSLWSLDPGDLVTFPYLVCHNVLRRGRQLAVPGPQFISSSERESNVVQSAQSQECRKLDSIRLLFEDLVRF